MASENALEKRIKRRVRGKVRDFFIQTAPGFEKVCFDELTSLPLSSKCAMIISGGVEFKGRVHDCYLANLRLSTANRILMRIKSFKATNFRQLDERLKGVDWELYFKPEQTVRIRVSSKSSRLYHKKAISERIRESLTARMDQFDATDDSETAVPQQLFVRIFDDRFTLSVDSSGELLYKRQLKTHGGKAPIRETIAAVALKLAGYTGNEPLLDPMCGAGTFPLEAALTATNIPPGWYRNFAFMDWPVFRGKRWSYIRNESEKEIHMPQTPFIVGSDKDENAIDKLQKSIEDHGLTDVIRVVCMDFFDLDPSSFFDQPGIVVINPPYGQRMGDARQSNQLIHDIFNVLKTTYKGWKAAIVLPRKHLVENAPFETTSHYFQHGGLQLVLITGIIS